MVESALASTADEMALVIMRSAYSAVVRDSMDYSTSLCDRHGQIVAQGLTLAGQLGTFPSIMRHVVARAADTHPGDVFIANDPFDAGGQHLPDIYVISPIFHDGSIEGYAATMAHHSDVGGLTAGSVALHASEIYQEGLRMPLLKLIDRGVDELGDHRDHRPQHPGADRSARRPASPAGCLPDRRARPDRPDR